MKRMLFSEMGAKNEWLKPKFEIIVKWSLKNNTRILNWFEVRERWKYHEKWIKTSYYENKINMGIPWWPFLHPHTIMRSNQDTSTDIEGDKRLSINFISLWFQFQTLSCDEMKWKGDTTVHNTTKHDIKLIITQSCVCYCMCGEMRRVGWIWNNKDMAHALLDN